MDPSILNGALGAVGSAISTAMNIRESQKQRDWNEQMMDKQND